MSHEAYQVVDQLRAFANVLLPEPLGAFFLYDAGRAANTVLSLPEQGGCPFQARPQGET